MLGKILPHGPALPIRPILLYRTVLSSSPLLAALSPHFYFDSRRLAAALNAVLCDDEYILISRLDRCVKLNCIYGVCLYLVVALTTFCAVWITCFATSDLIFKISWHKFKGNRRGVQYRTGCLWTFLGQVPIAMSSISIDVSCSMLKLYLCYQNRCDVTEVALHCNHGW